MNKEELEDLIESKFKEHTKHSSINSMLDLYDFTKAVKEILQEIKDNSPKYDVDKETHRHGMFHDENGRFISIDEFYYK